MIRYMGGLGQSSDPKKPSYDANGLPLVPGLIELVTKKTSAPGKRHEALRKHVGEIAIRTWQGNPEDPTTQVGGVGWILATEWVPYQKPTFVTPAFPGFVSGHSTFSRAAAEVMTSLTGSAFFPGGLGEFLVPKGSLTFEVGPSHRRAAPVGHLLRRRRPGGTLPAVRRHPYPGGRLRRPPDRFHLRQDGLGAGDRVLRGDRLVTDEPRVGRVCRRA